MVVVNIVTVQVERKCHKCQGSIAIGSPAIQDRRNKMVRTVQKDGNVRLERHLGIETEYYHKDCYLASR